MAKEENTDNFTLQVILFWVSVLINNSSHSTQLQFMWMNQYYISFCVLERRTRSSGFNLWDWFHDWRWIWSNIQHRGTCRWNGDWWSHTRGFILSGIPGWNPAPFSVISSLDTRKGKTSFDISTWRNLSVRLDLQNIFMGFSYAFPKVAYFQTESREVYHLRLGRKTKGAPITKCPFEFTSCRFWILQFSERRCGCTYEKLFWCFPTSTIRNWRTADW